MNSDFKKNVLEKFVTSAEDNIYAVRNSIPAEMFGAFGSYFSRNPKDFRENLWDAITGQIEEEKASFNEEDLAWLVSNELKEPYQAIKSGIAKSQDFFKRWYGKYSHKSIANTVWIPMVATNVSQLFARELAYDQLAFFIEQSTRYVKFDADNVHKDKDVMKSKHADVYQNTLEFLAESYKQFTEETIEYYKKLTPFDEWKKKNENLEDTKALAKYNREIKGQALDVSRFLLPQAVKTNIAWILDARSIEYDIAAWKGHPLEEIVNAANLIEKHAGQIAPSLLKYTEKNEYYAEKLRGYNLRSEKNHIKEFEKGVDIISYDPDALDKVIAYIIKRHNRGGTFRDRYRHVKKMGLEEKLHILDLISNKRGSHDEWIEMDEEFDLPKVTFEIRTDIGAIRDWRRHQKNDRSEALYTLDNGYHKPYMIKDMGGPAGNIFDNAINVAHKAEIVVRKDFPYQAQYLVPMAAMHSVIMSAGLDQLQYMIYTRSTPEGNFSYRKDAFNLAEEICKIYPWMIGLDEYPKDKSIEEVYEDHAVLKNIIKLQTGDTSFHT